eukprot:s550_g8.t1
MLGVRPSAGPQAPSAALTAGSGRGHPSPVHGRPGLRALRREVAAGSLVGLAFALPRRDSTRGSCGRMALKATAVPATMQDGVLLIEHLNLNVSSTQVALEFYEALGCCRDARRPMGKTLHSNCGALTQFHTPSPDNEAYIADAGPQQWRGVISVAYAGRTELQEAVQRLEQLKSQEHFRDTQLEVGDWQEESQELLLRGPYGNRFRLHVASAPLALALGRDRGGRPGRPGSEGSCCVGMDSLTLEVPVGTAERAAQFYKEVLGCQVASSDEHPGVRAGPELQQSLRFQEVEGSTGAELGEHMAIYVADFEGCFQRLLDRGLIWVNPRFVHLDKSTTLEEALHYSCFRFKDVVVWMPSGSRAVLVT